jgi:WD40 repeat protein
VKAATSPAAPPTDSVFSPATSDGQYNYSLKWTLSQHVDCVRAVVFHTLFPYVATASDDGTIRFTNLDPPRRPKARRVPVMYMSLRGHSCPVLSMAVHSQRLFSGDCAGVLCVWDFGEARSALFDVQGAANHHQLSEMRFHTDAIWSLASSENVNFVVSASADRTIAFIDCGSLVAAPHPLDDPPAAVAFFENGTRFAVGCCTGAVIVFDSDQRTEISRIALPVAVTGIAGVGSRIAVALEDGTVKICTGEAVEREFVAHTKPIGAIVTVPDGSVIVTTAADLEIHAFGFVTGKQLFAEKVIKEKFGEGGLALAVTPRTHSSTLIALGGADGTVKLFGPE